MNSLMEMTDEQLIKLYSAGNNDALSTIVERHKNKIYTSIFLLIKDKYLAEDIFQDVFIQIINTISLGRYNEEGKFIQWAMRIAHNKCIDYFRKMKSTPTIKTSDDKDIFDVLNFSEKGVDQKIIKQETSANVRKLIDMLPNDQREIIILRHYADLTFKQIAALNNISINTALGRMRYALITLRKIIKGTEFANS